MGRKLDALLGRNFKTSKFKTLAKLAISRISILKNQHQVRYSQARSDVIELLNLGHHEQALLRVDHLIKEQNMVDAFTIMESYCNLLIERVMLIQKNKECPDELKEATSSLMFASSRCGEFPELLHIRGVLSSTFGKEFVARAVELRNSCSVHPKIIQKLSTRRPSLETKLKLLKEIASEKGITLHLEAMDVNEKQDDLPKGIGLNEGLITESTKARKTYRDVADAAQEAFESAAHAAEAARAAVELSRIGPKDFDSDDNQSGFSHTKGAKVDSDETMVRTRIDLELNEIEETKQNLWIERTLSTSSSDISADEKLSLDEVKENDDLGDDKLAISQFNADDIEELSLEQLREKDDQGDDELAISVFDTDMEKAKDETQKEKFHDLSSDITQIEEINEDESKLGYESSKLTNTESLNFEEPLHSHMNKKWVSMRTRRDNITV